MKKFRFNPLPFLLLSTFLFQCMYHDDVDRYKNAVFLSIDELRTTRVSFHATRALKKPGKIYFKDNYLFINEINEGIHIFDNNNPSDPKKLGFIKILGNVDMAIRGNTLFVDSYIDLLSIDISDILSLQEKRYIRVLQRVENVFEHNFYIDSRGIAISERLIGSIEQSDYQVSKAGVGCQSQPSPSTATSTGEGGSLARFALSSNYLQVLGGSAIEVYDVTLPNQIKHESTVSVSSGIETLWAYQDKLFIGSTEAMYILDNTNPAEPVLLGMYSHIFGCDPVVVEGDVAYVTLREASACNRTVNQLHIIDISNPKEPFPIAIASMFNPYGLGIDNGTLFLCDGDEGLKIYDASNPKNIQLITRYRGVKGIDVIPLGNILLVIAEDGLYQYDYSNLSGIKLLSKISVQ